MAVTHPVYRQPSGWQAQLVPRCPEPRLRRNLRCDLAVIGAGPAGLAAARTWAEARPDAGVALLEAGIVGSSGSGRSCGFLLESMPARGSDPAGVERTVRGNALLGETAQWLRALIAAHAIQCGLRRTGAYRAATARGRVAIERHRAGLEAAGLAFEVLDAVELERRLGTRHYRYGLFLPDCSLVQPAALVRGLADSLPGNVTLYEETPALEIAAEGAHWRIECPDGSLLARQLLLANDAFVPRLGIGRGRLVARFAYAGLTEPLADAQLAGLGSETDWGLLPAHPSGVSLRRTNDGRMLVSAFRGYGREEDHGRVAERLRHSVARRFPQLGIERWTRPFEHVWGGATGFTYNGAPLWGEVHPGLFVSAGGSGHGLVKGTLLGRLLAQRALGDAVPDVAALFGRATGIPPEPVLRLWLSLAWAWERRSLGADD